MPSTCQLLLQPPFCWWYLPHIETLSWPHTQQPPKTTQRQSWFQKQGRQSHIFPPSAWGFGWLLLPRLWSFEPPVKFRLDLPKKFSNLVLGILVCLFRKKYFLWVSRINFSATNILSIGRWPDSWTRLDGSSKKTAQGIVNSCQLFQKNKGSLHNVNHIILRMRRPETLFPHMGICFTGTTQWCNFSHSHTENFTTFIQLNCNISTTFQTIKGNPNLYTVT